MKLSTKKIYHTFLAVDPGEVHCGVALFELYECSWAKEFAPQELFTFITQAKIDGLVSESFQLYPWKSRQLGFSSLGVVETIGVMRYLLKQRQIPMVEQPATIKQVITRQLTARGYVWKSKGHGGHAKDAEMHGNYFVAKNSGKILGVKA